MFLGATVTFQVLPSAQVRRLDARWGTEKRGLQKLRPDPDEDEALKPRKPSRKAAGVLEN